MQCTGASCAANKGLVEAERAAQKAAKAKAAKEAAAKAKAAKEAAAKAEKKED